MIRPAAIFGEALAGPGAAALRERVSALAAERAAGSPLRVDTVLALHDRLVRGGAAGGDPACWLLMDPHRWVLYEEGEGAPGVGSVVRFLVDAYPVQPPSLVRSAPYRFLYAPDTLDVLPLFWPGTPGTVIVGDFVTGEIAARPALAHPADDRPRVISAGDEPAGEGDGSPSPAMVLGDAWTDASLRSAAAPALDGLVSAASGIVRERTETTDHASLPYAVARVSWAGGSASEFCGGKSALPSEAARVAACEAAERFQVTFARPGETLVRGTFAELRGRAVDPRDLFFHAVPGGDFGLRPYADDAPALWTPADDPLGGPPRLVPAEEIWFDVGERHGTGYFVAQTTSGSALGATAEEAAAFAMLEAVERDAFLTAWYLRRPCAPIDPDSVASEAFQLLRRRWESAYADYSFHLFDATGDAGVPVVTGVAVRRRGTGPRAFVSAAARLTAERACHAALKDLAGFLPVLPEEKRRAYRASLEAPERIRGPAGHFETYALDEAFGRLSFLDLSPAPPGAVAAAEIDARALIRPAERHQPREVVRRVAAHLRTLGAALYLKEMTHPEMARRGLRCVRAVTPGLYPMWFGPATRRFAVTDRLRRLAREWTGREVRGDADCNLDVHPLA